MAQKSQHETCFIPFFVFISIPNTLLIKKLLPAFAHLKGYFICLMYDFPKILSFIEAMGLKVHPHFQTVLINTLSSIFDYICRLYLSHSALQLPIYLSLRYVHCFVSELSPKRQSLIIIYISVYKGRSEPHCFLLFVHL